MLKVSWADGVSVPRPGARETGPGVRVPGLRQQGLRVRRCQHSVDKLTYLGLRRDYTDHPYYRLMRVYWCPICRQYRYFYV